MQRTNENDEILLNNALKYRKKLQAAVGQINRTKKFAQRNLESSDAEIHGENVELFFQSTRFDLNPFQSLG